MASCPTQALRVMDESALKRLQRERQIRSAQGQPLAERRGARRDAILDKAPRVGAKKLAAEERKAHLPRSTSALANVMPNMKANVVCTARKKPGATGPARYTTIFPISFDWCVRAKLLRPQNSVIKVVRFRRSAAGSARRTGYARAPVR